MYFSPLRYPGGKASLAKNLSELIETNSKQKCIFIEPFAGGAGAALTLLMTNKVSKIALNDVDHFVYAFWFSVVHHTKELVSLIRKTKICIQEWKKQRKIYRQYKDKKIKIKQLLKIGFATFFLNRCNRSGIFYAGPIGGQKQTGKFLIDARFNKEKLILRIENIAKRKKDIELFNMDAILFMKKYKIKNKNTLFYIDPPYYQKGKSLYNCFYKKDEHHSLASFLENFNSDWVLSYDDVAQIKKLYKENIKSFKINYCIRKANVGKEIIILSKEISFDGNITPTKKIPKVNVWNQKKKEIFKLAYKYYYDYKNNFAVICGNPKEIWSYCLKQAWKDAKKSNYFSVVI